MTSLETLKAIRELDPDGFLATQECGERDYKRWVAVFEWRVRTCYGDSAWDDYNTNWDRPDSYA